MRQRSVIMGSVHIIYPKMVKMEALFHVDIVEKDQEFHVTGKLNPV